MICSNCGKEIVSNAKFCNSCGSPVVVAEPTQQSAAVKTIVTSDAQENKVVFMLAYLGILFFLPLVSCPESKAGRFHANQGLVLLLTSIAGQIAISFLSAIILAISWRLFAIISLLSFVWVVALIALVIIGMMNANKGLQKPLPIIGGITIIK